MPRERFYKLPEEKQKRILNATVNEISNVNIDNLSINQIVKSAGIPRGSFYEYFENKYDLIDYIMSDYKEMKIKNIEESLVRNNGDIFQAIFDFCDFVFDFCFNEQNYNVYKNVFSCLKIDKTHNFEFPFEFEKLIKNAVLPRINIDKLSVESDFEIECLVDILINIVRSTIVNVFINPVKKMDYLDKLRIQIDIIKSGAVKLKSEDII